MWSKLPFGIQSNRKRRQHSLGTHKPLQSYTDRLTAVKLACILFVYVFVICYRLKQCKQCEPKNFGNKHAAIGFSTTIVSPAFINSLATAKFPHSGVDRISIFLDVCGNVSCSPSLNCGTNYKHKIYQQTVQLHCFSNLCHMRINSAMQL